MIEYENLGKLNFGFYKDYLKSFLETCESGWYILGKNVTQFENEFAEYCGIGHCVGVANGLEALEISLKCSGLVKGDEVIVPSNTYIATILAIVQCGLTPVLVEPDILTYNIDPNKIEDKITSRTKALLVVHLYGKCCEMDRIISIGKKNKLVVLEDCAQAHGAMHKGKKSGTFGDFGCFSFYPTKNLGALGDAGAIVVSEKDSNEKLRALRNYGSKIKYVNEYIGYNSRLDEIQAGFLSIKLKHLDLINEHKRKLASLYFKYLKEDFIKPITHPDFYDVFHIFNIRHEKRDELKNYLLKKDIHTEIHYPIPPYKQKAMSDFLAGDYPITDAIHATTLSLPISFFHTEDDVIKVIEEMNKF